MVSDIVDRLLVVSFNVEQYIHYENLIFSS